MIDIGQRVAFFLIFIILANVLLFALTAACVLLIGRYLRQRKAARDIPEPTSEPAASEPPLTASSRSLGETLRENRLRCGMTQENAAEALGVSRQAVSKWENGTADPTISNLLALAKLYDVSAEDLLQAAAGEN